MINLNLRKKFIVSYLNSLYHRVEIHSFKGIMQDILANIACKVVLEDFDYKRDLNLRLYVEKLSTEDMFVLEEILYSPLKVCLEDLGSNVDLPKEKINEIVENLLPLNLFTVDNGFLLVNKEMRKHLEALIEKFSPDFQPNLDYFKEILKLVPIHCLVAWFHIPRTSNNIFNSILEKYFSTPRLYLRYVKNTLAEDKHLEDIFNYINNSTEGSVPVEEILETFPLSEEELEEKILFLEYHFILASTFKIKDGYYKKHLSLFSEWNDWNSDICNSSSLKASAHTLTEENVVASVSEEFSFIKDMALILELSALHPLKVEYNQKDELFYLTEAIAEIERFHDSEAFYLARLINKNLLLGLIVIENDKLRQTPPAKKWLETPLKKRTLITFKHPHNSLSQKCDFSFHQHDRNIIEVQKALSKIEKDRWVLFDEFIEDYFSNTNLLKQAELVRVGRNWKYAVAEYDKNEIVFIKTVVMDWLFESGMIISGLFNNEDCFKVTSLGYELYS